MAQRRKDARLIELEKRGIRPYSISRLNAIDGCLLEAYYTYRMTPKPPQSPNIYGIMGTKVHDGLEKIYNNEAGKEILLPALQSELSNADLLNVDFPRDFKGGTTIRDNWISDMTNFCNTFEKMDGQFSTEELVILPVGDRYLIGYIDLIQIVDEESKKIRIYDFKTSSKFKKDDLKHHGRQLIVYGLAKRLQGYEIEGLAWIMLKYVKVAFDGYARVNSKTKTRIEKVVQRSKFAKEMSPVVEKILTEAGYDEIDIDIILSNFKESNSVESLPEIVQNQLFVEQYIEEYPFTEELIQETLDYINTRAEKFESLWDKPIEDWTPVTIDKNQIFYCTNLCSHRDHCEALAKYRLKQELDEISDIDLF